MKKRRTICVHLLNDWSRSAQTLAKVIDGLAAEGHDIDLFTAQKEKAGYLSKVRNVHTQNFNYQPSTWRIVALFWLIFSQIQVFFKLWAYRKEEVSIYVNTLYPFGAALAGKWMNKKVIYHLHETTQKSSLLHRFLWAIVKYTASDVIYSSNYLQQQHSLNKVKEHVIYDVPSESFHYVSQQYINQPRAASSNHSFTVLMVCTTKGNSGVKAFIEIAEKMPNAQFELVVDGSQTALMNHLEKLYIPDNVQLFSLQDEGHDFYQRANITLQLSDVNNCTNTWGICALEAMLYGLPVIVSPRGEITEIVENGKSGYHIKANHLSDTIEKIYTLMNDDTLYQEIAQQAQMRAKQFYTQYSHRSIQQIVVQSKKQPAKQLMVEETIINEQQTA